MASVEQSTQQGLYSNGGGVPAVPAHPNGAGQVIPGSKARPRVSTTLWEDENTLCFQVEARGISVARREDNDMINGTKLLNVAGMTRGRRDGMLKAEKDRRVVKIGAMHLKGVWIPFDRAINFAQKEGIADLLFPLLVEDIRSYLYRQTNPAGAEIPLMLPGEKYPQQKPAQGQPQQQTQTPPTPAQQQQLPQQQQQQQQQQQYNRQYPQGYAPYMQNQYQMGQMGAQMGSQMGGQMGVQGVQGVQSPVPGVQTQGSVPGLQSIPGQAAQAAQGQSSQAVPGQNNYPYQYPNYPQMMYPSQGQPQQAEAQPMYYQQGYQPGYEYQQYYKKSE